MCGRCFRAAVIPSWPVVGDADLEAADLEQAAQDFGGIAIVLDDEDPHLRLTVHGISCCGRPLSRGARRSNSVALRVAASPSHENPRRD
jgi:hypothetical protein